MDLKFEGSDVKGLMYKGKDILGSKMLESGTILLLLDDNLDWAKKRWGLDFSALAHGDSITCKAFGVEKDWKNVSQIHVTIHAQKGTSGYFKRGVIDISDLKNGPQNLGKATITLEGNELTFKNNTSQAYYDSILVEAYNE